MRHVWHEAPANRMNYGMIRGNGILTPLKALCIIGGISNIACRKIMGYD
jgi:hypothetical protein